MAEQYTAFKHAVFEAGVEKALRAKHVFVDGCETRYKGKLVNKGNKVIMHTMADITVKSLAMGAIYDEIDPAEHLSTDDLEVVVDQVRYFNVEVSNIDEVQSDTNIFNEFMESAANGFAEEEDKFVANFANTEGLTKVTTVEKLGAANVMDVVLAARTELKKKNVKSFNEVEMIVTPEFESVIIKAGILQDTNNSDLIANGYIGKILGIRVKVSNNVAKNTAMVDSDGIGTLDMIQFRVRNRACAFVEQLKDFKMYEPEKQIDTYALKGCILFGGKVLRPNEIVVIPVKAYEQYTIVPAA